VERISSYQTFFFKWVMPLGWAALAVALAVFAVSSGALEGHAGLLAVPLIALALCILTFRHGSGAADEVRDGGSFLLVRWRGIEERVQLADVASVDIQRFVNPRLLTLRLRQPGRLGDTIAFFPTDTFQFNPFARHPLVDSLVQRVDRLRDQA
jgi:hypothetical protein